MTEHKGIEFTDNGWKEYERIMVTLGSKTKKLFTIALQKEHQETWSRDHQMLMNADVTRVAQNLKLI